jgi:hypothetical protein
MEFLDWNDWDPDYPLNGGSDDCDKENQPVGPDDWADDDDQGG